MSKLRLMGLDVNELSPNQLAKRDEIIRAVQEVLLRSGPVGCTTREVARVGQLNKGLIYYYFDSLEEIVDAAMAAFAEEAAAAMPRPTDLDASDKGSSALARSYLALFSHRDGLALAWLEYWAMCIRAGRNEQLIWLADQMIELLTAALAETEGDNAPTRARVVASYIIGVIVRSLADPTVLEELDREYADLPRATQNLTT